MTGAEHTVATDWHLWLGFLGASFAIAFFPGAGAIQSMASGLTHGLLRSYWSIAGQEVGLMFQLILVAVGLGAVVAKSVAAFTIIKFIGVAYLFYLAARQLRASGGDLREQLSASPVKGGLPLLARGFLVNATNPKALVFYLAVLPQFVEPTVPLLRQYVIIGSTFVAVDVVVMSIYAALATRLHRVLGPRRQLVLNRFFSGLFVTAAVVLALVRRAAV
ncbi:LysE family transporter [Mycobacterium sp. AZCC_0083]|uniref:LysE family transporter n=1 Tax=Mycobacterium sp. AZCC_0083 TaxID=2735882 RepID=UPI0016152AD9|nr:LysE family transporter [Mycobacterium sp. AZCC_0083]MBB5167543.1 homoserine/homoserine lactone efflux protein [Mycobacterium sp. AZCC_0083]